MTVAQRTSANRIITAKGQAVTLTRIATGAYDPATGSASTTTTTQTGRAVILDFATGLRKMAGSNIPLTDRQLLLSAVNSSGAALTAPVVDDSVTAANGDVFTVVEVSPLSPAGLDIIYTCTIRGAA